MEKQMTAEKTQPQGLELLRAPFPKNLILKLPKPTKRQTDDLKAGMAKQDFSLGKKCKECGQWHHKDVVHLDYVGHAALTDRLLDCDINWNWEPMALGENGLPAINGGMWIKLTVCGQTRLGYGDADGKTGGNAIKEMIGDGMRNAAMRFGAALDLWHKGDLHVDDEPDPSQPVISAEQFVTLKAAVDTADTDETKFLKHFGASSLEQFPTSKLAAARKMLKQKQDDQAKATDLGGDSIPH